MTDVYIIGSLASIAIALVVLTGTTARVVSVAPAPLRLFARLLEGPKWLGLVVLIAVSGVSVGAALSARAARTAEEEKARANREREMAERARQMERERIEKRALELVARVDELARPVASALALLDRGRIEDAERTLGAIRGDVGLLRSSTSATAPQIAALIGELDAADRRLRELRVGRAIQRADAALANKRPVLERIRAIDAAEQTLSALASSSSGAEPELAAPRDKLSVERATLAQGVRVVGAELELAKAVLGARLVDRGKGRFEVNGYPGVEVYLATQSGRVVAAYAVAQPRTTGSIIPRVLAAIVRDVVAGGRFDAAKVERVGSGLATTRAELGRLPVSFGWDGSRLIEVAVGRFEP